MSDPLDSVFLGQNSLTPRSTPSRVMKSRWVATHVDKSNDRSLCLDWNYLQGTKTHKHTYEHTHVNIHMNTAHDIVECAPTAAAINDYLPGSHGLGIALPWTAPSHYAAQQLSETPAPCSAPSSCSSHYPQGVILQVTDNP